jgi:hypothetical protein
VANNLKNLLEESLSRSCPLQVELTWDMNFIELFSVQVNLPILLSCYPYGRLWIDNSIVL